jgi:hypothetical protein
MSFGESSRTRIKRLTSAAQSPACDLEREQGCRKCLSRKSQPDDCLMIEPLRLFGEPVAQRGYGRLAGSTPDVSVCSPTGSAHLRNHQFASLPSLEGAPKGEAS